MRLATVFCIVTSFLLLIAAGCGAKMTDEQDPTAGTGGGVEGAYKGSAGSSGNGGAAVAGQSGTGSIAGAGGNTGWPGTAGTAGVAGEPGAFPWWPGTGGDEGWPGTAGWPGTGGDEGWPGTPGWPGTGGDEGWPGMGRNDGWSGGGDTNALEDTPPAVQETVAGLLGNPPVEEIQQNFWDGTYEVSATVDGNRVDYIIAEDGTLIQSVEEIDSAAIPDAVQTAVTAEIGDGQIRRIEKVTEEGEVYYEIRATGANGERVRLIVAEDGTLIDRFGGGRRNR